MKGDKSRTVLVFAIVVAISLVGFIAVSNGQSTPRFQKQECGKIQDTKTKLEWIPDRDRDDMDWYEAKAHIEQLNRDKFCGHTDWRFPHAGELKMLHDLNKKTPIPHKKRKCRNNWIPMRRHDVYIDPIFLLDGGRVWTGEEQQQTSALGPTAITFDFRERTDYFRGTSAKDSHCGIRVLVVREPKE